MYSRDFFNDSVAHISVPKLTFEYGIVMDWLSKPPVPEDLKNKLKEQLPEFTQSWKEKGEPLLKMTVCLIGKKFNRHELTAACVLNPDVCSMSQPLIINAASYIENKDNTGFVYDVYLQLVRLYIEEHFHDLLQSSNLANSFGVTPGFLFACSVTHAVFQSTGRVAELNQLTAGTAANSEAKKAWEVVKQDDGYKLFIQELKEHRGASAILFKEERSKPYVPHIFLEYAKDLDESSGALVPHSLITRFRNELMPELAEYWKNKGTELVQATVAFFKKGFPQQELSVALALDPNTRPMSFPLLTNARRQFHLNDGLEKRSRHFFVHNVYQLLLFRFVNANFPDLDHRSALIEKYAKEADGVKNRLFPFAITVHIYNHLGRGEELEKVMQNEVTLKEMIRAWEIIQDVGPQPFLDELLHYDEAYQLQRRAIV